MAQASSLFLLDRDTGTPLFPVEEHPVPASTVEGERAWPTQPFPTAPPPLVPQRISLDDVFGITEGDRAWCRERLEKLRYGAIFTPPSLEGTLIFPGNIGGMNWEVPLGRMPHLAQFPESSKWGSINLGGAILTAGGLVFIAAAWDNYLRAFDIETGKELWKGALPAGGQATPMTYLSKNGKQYVVIAAGGHGRMRTTLGDHVVAFALP